VEVEGVHSPAVTLTFPNQGAMLNTDPTGAADAFAAANPSQKYVFASAPNPCTFSVVWRHQVGDRVHGISTQPIHLQRLETICSVNR
jgi:hypothetical protein